MCTGSESRAVLENEQLISNVEVEEECEIVEVGEDGEGVTLSSREQMLQSVLQRLFPYQVAEDLRSLLMLVCPVTLMTLLLHSKAVISMLFLGHLGNAELAGGSLAMSFASITGFSVIKGLSMGMEPICCQAFGARQLSVISKTFQRTLCLLLITAIGIAALWLNMEPILLLLRQDADIVAVAKLFLIYSIPELIAQVHLHTLRSFLRTQGITTPLTVVTSVCLVLHLPMNYFLVVYLHLGVKGVALAAAWNTISLDLGLLVYLIFSTVSVKPWDGLTLVSPFQGWKKLLSLALPSLLSVCLEWWWYEIMLLLCGILQNPKASVAAMGILIQTTGLLYVFPYALSTGLSTRIGHELGADHPQRAQNIARIGLISAMLMGMTAFIFTVAVRSVWGMMYTSESDILDLVTLALPVLGFCELGNCPQTAACGVLTGSARSKTGAKINFIAFYLVGLPVAVVIAFTLKVGFVGLWFGLAAAQAACMGMMIATLLRTNWKEEARRSRELTRGAETANDLETPMLS